MSIIGETGVWIQRTHHVTDVSLVSCLSNYFRKFRSSVYDLGCGAGGYSKIFKATGLDVICYDGSPNTEVITDGLCGILDLAKPLPSTIEPRDWTLCLEVGEHIPKKYEQAFIDNLAKVSKKGIVVSWAVPGQSGHGHVNCQDNEYVCNEFVRRGFRTAPYMQAQLRKAATFSYFKRTIMVFKNNKNEDSNIL